MTLLHIASSPRGADSDSLRIARVFTETYVENHPGADLDHWDLWDGSLPDFAEGAKAKMTVFGGGTPAGAQARAWA
jgi:FMN-dependent NADH-azoreductase